MNHLASDTFEILEDLEESGLDKKQAKAIFQVIRQSHEAKDASTQHALKEIERILSSEIKEVDQKLFFEMAEIKRDIADVRKDIDIAFEKMESRLQARFEKHETQISLSFKDVEHFGSRLLQKLTVILVSVIALSVTIHIGLVVKFL